MLRVLAQRDTTMNAHMTQGPYFFFRTCYPSLGPLFRRK